METVRSMATAALVSVSEYLNTSYRPDQELLEGRLVERNLGEYDHSNLQGALVARTATSASLVIKRWRLRDRRFRFR